MDGSDTNLPGASLDANQGVSTLDSTSPAAPAVNPNYTYNPSSNPSYIGADINSQQAGNKSIFDSATDLVTKGVPLVGASVINSFANTAIELGNWTGVTNDAQKLSIEDEFGTDSDTTAYYQQHAVPIEVAGLVAGSLIPGLGATKLLKIATATGRFSSEFSAATGLLSGFQDAAIKDAIGESIGNSDATSLFGSTLLAKTKAIAFGAADNALQGGVYQLATLATMKASPLTDSNTIHQNVSDVIDSALGFGILGGGINALQTLGNIKTAVTKLDQISKEAELVGTKGLGNITIGDRITGLFAQAKSFEAQQASGKFSDLLSQRKAESTSNVVNRQLNAEFDALTKDPEVAGAFKAFAMKDAAAIPIDPVTGTANLEDFAQKYGQLSKVGRLGDTKIAAPVSDAFYINPTVDLSSLLKTAGQDGTLNATQHLDQISTSILNQDNQLAKAVQLKTPGVLPVIGHALQNDDNSLIALSEAGPKTLPSVTPLYKNTQDAFSKGVDIFIDKNGGTHLNLSSDSALIQVARPGESRILSKAERVAYNATGQLLPNSEPLNTSALFLNLKDGTITGEAPLPVVGDIAKPKFTSNGLQIGSGPDSSFTKFTAGNGEEFSPSSPFEANKEYVWNAMRGVQRDDVIHPENLPQLESLYSSMLKDEARNPEAEESLPERFGVSFSDGSEVPTTSADLFTHIQQTKMQKIIDLLGTDKSSDEIAQIANVEPKVISSGGAGKLDNSDWIIPAADHQNINTVRLAYDISNKLQISPENILRGTQAVNYRYQLATQANTDATAKFLNWIYGGDGSKATNALSAMKVTADPSGATLYGAGEGAITAANSSYGTIGQQFERVGRNFSDLQTLRHTAINEALAPSLVKIKNNPQAAAELGVFTYAQRSAPNGERYVFLNPDLATKYNLPENTTVLEGSLKYKKGVQDDWSPDYKPDGYVPGGTASGLGIKTYYTLSPEVADVQRAHAALLASRNDMRDNFRWAQGLDRKNYNPEALYPPPINTARTPYFAFVKQRPGYAMGEGGSTILVAKSADDLRSKLSLLPPEYVAYTKADSKEYFQAKGEYDFNRNFTSTKVQTDLASKGILTGFVPEQRADNLVNEFVDFHKNQETQLLRDYTELHNADTFAKLQAMGERYVSTGNARFGSSGLKYNPSLAPDNPYASYMRTALGVSSKDNYPFWNQAQEKIEAFAGTAYNAAQSMLGKLQKGIVTPEQSDAIMQKFGIGNPYGNSLKSFAAQKAYYGGLANRLPDPQIFSKVIGTANAVLHKTVIAMDPIQQLVHAVTLPIMTALEHGPVTADMQKLLSTELPQAAGAAQIQVPTFMRSMYGAIKDFIRPDGMDPEFAGIVNNKQLGIPRDQRFQMQKALHSLTVPGVGEDGSKNAWLGKIQAAADFAEKLSLTKHVNEFNHFVASNVGWQLAKAKGLSGQGMIDDISTFTNRVLGNLSAGQRGALFHGPVGQAVGLFQSYQFNLLQQVFRHVEEGQGKAIALAGGLQSAIFGLSSLPGFKALNTLIQQHQGNSSADDIYTEAVKNLGPTFGNWALYGGVTGLTGAALYSRGDINPRRPTVIPLNPMDIPSVSSAIRIYQNVARLASNIGNGGNVPASLMLALEHNGLSRPLTGMIEMMQGYSTDAKGNLLSAPNNSTMGMSDYASIANMSRLLGARPLDESIALEQLNNYNVNKAATQARLESLGEAFKTQLYSADRAAPDTATDFAARYAAAGGNSNNFNRFMLDATNKAHNPVANKVLRAMGSDPRAANSMIRMGGIPLPGYQPQGPTEQVASVSPDAQPVAGEDTSP